MDGFRQLVVLEDGDGVRVAYTPEEFMERYNGDEARVPEGYWVTWFEDI
jgi:hypothetical protein